MREMNGKVIQSYVFRDDGAFFVSTMNRESSAPEAVGFGYAETIAWRWDPQTRDRGEMIGMDSCAAGSITTHQRRCRELHDTGKWVE